jgi:hypothetical protein
VYKNKKSYFCLKSLRNDNDFISVLAVLPIPMDSFLRDNVPGMFLVYFYVLRIGNSNVVDRRFERIFRESKTF